MKGFQSPVFVHSDAGRLRLELRKLGILSPAAQVPRDLMSFLSGLCADGEDGLVFPAFNYDFPRTGIFNVKDDPVQVGALPEWIRRSGRFERTAVPFYSVLHRDSVQIPEQASINPFGPESFFAQLLSLQGTVLLAGVGVDRLTLIHFIEDLFGPPIYRYDKEFLGRIETPQSNFECEVKMHVRPPTGLDYDWEKIDCELRERRILRQVRSMPNVYAAQVDQLVDFLGAAIVKNPTFLLTDSGTERLFPLGTDYAQRVERKDFEHDAIPND